MEPRIKSDITIYGFAIGVRRVVRANAAEWLPRVGCPAEAHTTRPSADIVLRRYVASNTAFKLDPKSPRAESRCLLVLRIDRCDVIHGRVHHRYTHTIYLKTRRLCPRVRRRNTVYNVVRPESADRDLSIQEYRHAMAIVTAPNQPSRRAINVAEIQTHDGAESENGVP